MISEFKKLKEAEVQLKLFNTFVAGGIDEERINNWKKYAEHLSLLQAQLEKIRELDKIVCLLQTNFKALHDSYEFDVQRFQINHAKFEKMEEQLLGIFIIFNFVLLVY